MAYINEEDFAEAFGQRELDDLLSSGADFERAASAANGVIDGYLAARYTLPLATTPELVRAWALDITRFRLWDEQAPEEVRRRYEDALEQLRDLAAGRMSLPPDAQGAQPVAAFETEGYHDERVFTADTLADFG